MKRNYLKEKEKHINNTNKKKRVRKRRETRVAVKRIKKLLRKKKTKTSQLMLRK